MLKISFLGLFLAFTLQTSAQTQPDLIPYRKGYKWGFCDKNKKIIIECKYDFAWFFSEGLAWV